MTAPVDPAERGEPRLGPVLVAISAGGVCGAAARYAVSVAWPHPVTGVPWATLLINVSGCLLIGALMVIVTEVLPGRRLLRPFLGVGVLGAYTTFSTYIIEVHEAAAAGAPLVALLYLAGTAVGALLAVWAGTALMSGLVRRGTRRERP